MNLPSDYLQVVRLGTNALRSVGAQVRGAAVTHPETPELWLSVRDFEGLAGRLADSTDWEWRHGFADIVISPQDLGVLDDLLERGRVGPVRLSDGDAAPFTRLCEFLRQYCNREFELDESTAHER